MDEDVYKRHGYNDRADYLQSLAEEYGLDYEMICAFANLLGPNEDFDGLINTLEDACNNDDLDLYFDDEFDEELDDFDFNDEDDEIYQYDYDSSFYIDEEDEDDD